MRPNDSITINSGHYNVPVNLGQMNAAQVAKMQKLKKQNYIKAPY